jgi:hypothetical protein
MHADATAATIEKPTESRPDTTISAEPEFYLVQNRFSAKCEIVQGRAEGEDLVAVGKAHKSRREATIAMKATNLCRTD